MKEIIVNPGGVTALLEQKVSKQHVSLTNGTAVTYTLPINTAFILLIERANTTGAGYSGLYVGFAHTNSHITEVKGSNYCTVSISGKTLTMTASQTNMGAYIIYDI